MDHPPGNFRTRLGCTIGWLAGKLVTSSLPWLLLCKTPRCGGTNRGEEQESKHRTIEYCSPPIIRTPWRPHRRRHPTHSQRSLLLGDVSTEILVGLVKEGVHLLIRSLLRWVEKMKQRVFGSLGTTVDSYAKIFAPRL